MVVHSRSSKQLYKYIHTSTRCREHPRHIFIRGFCSYKYRSVEREHRQEPYRRISNEQPGGGAMCRYQPVDGACLLARGASHGCVLLLLALAAHQPNSWHFDPQLLWSRCERAEEALVFFECKHESSRQPAREHDTYLVGSETRQADGRETQVLLQAFFTQRKKQKHQISWLTALSPISDVELERPRPSSSSSTSSLGAGSPRGPWG